MIKKVLKICIMIILVLVVSECKIAYADEIIYEEIQVTIPEGQEYEASSIINKELAKASTDRSKYYKIIISAQEGKSLTQYYCKSQIRLYSNTWLFVDDKNGQTPIVFNKCHMYAMVTAENRDLETVGYDGFKNIKIEGGIWNGKTDYINGEYYNNAGFNHFRFAHGTNFELKNLSVINNNNAHHVQIAGVDGFKVSGCTFDGYNRLNDSYKEAIQLDILSSPDVFGSASKYDDTPMKNVEIYNNVFRNVDRGVGTHSATVGVYHKNVKIYNNKFINIDDYAIALMNYKDTVVEDNVMSNVEGGVIFMYAKSDFSQFYQPTVLEPEINPESTTIIRNNDITLNNDLNSVGIRSYGIKSTDTYKAVMTKAGVDVADYSVSGITIEDNVIKNARGDGIGLVGTYNSTISRNKIYYAYDNSISTSYGSAKGIYLKSSSSNNVSSNVIDNSAGCNNLKHGIIAYNSSVSNTIKSNFIRLIKWYGINIKDSSSATIDSNTIDGTKKTGIYIYGKSTVDVKNNNIRNMASGHGIYYEQAYGSCVNGNRISGVKNNGIYLYNGAKVTSVQNNQISSTGDHAIYIRTKSQCTNLDNNAIVQGSAYGIYIDYKCSVTNVLSNNINKSGKIGIYINNRASVKLIKSNVISATKSNAIYIKNSSVSDVIENVIKLCKVTYIKGSTVARINKNTITGSASHGLYVKESVVSNINKNNLNSNKSNGIYIYASKVASLNGNSCESNKKKGIYIRKSKITTINSNKLNSNKSNGLYIENSIVKTVKSNTLKSNTSHGLYVYKATMTNLNSNNISGSKYNGLFVNASTVTNVKSNIVSSCKENGMYLKSKSKIKYLYNNKVTKSKMKAIYIYKSTVSKKKGNTGKIVIKK